MGDINGENTFDFGYDDEPVRRVRLTPASAIKPRPVKWLWQGRIPAGELVLTPGRGGIGKSTFHAWAIAHVTNGTMPGAYEGHPRPAIIAATEDSWDRTIVPRLIVAGADLDKVYRVDVVTDDDGERSISLPSDVNGLANEIVRTGAALLSVDPLLGVISGGLDTHKNRDVRQALQPLTGLADKTGCTVLGNAHFNKSSGSDPLSLITGSAAFGEVTRAALGFARDPEADDGSCVISQVKNNLGRSDLPSLRYVIETATIDTDEGLAEVGRFVMVGETDRSVADILRDGGNGDESTERREVDQWLTDYLTEAGGQALAADVIAAAKAAGFNENTIQKARRRIKAKSERTGFGKGSYCTWILIDSIDSRSQKPGTYGTYADSMGATGVTVTAPPTLVCEVCGDPLDPIHGPHGTHPLCDPEVAA